MRNGYENHIIDCFLTELAKGTRPHTAASRAGATLRTLQGWRDEDTQEAKIFAEQWENAAEIGNDLVEQTIWELATIGQPKYVTTKDGIAKRYNPKTCTWEPIIEHVKSEAMLKLLAQARIREYAPRTAGRSSDDSFNTDDVVNDRAPIDADEPGPTSPIL